MDDIIEESYDAGSEITYVTIQAGVFGNICNRWNTDYTQIIDWWYDRND